MPAQNHLTIWDEAAAATREARGLVLSAAYAGASPRDVADWPVGARNAHLLSAYARDFGGSFELFARCASCGEEVSFQTRIDDLLAVPECADWPIRLAHDGFLLACWRPSTADLARAWSGTSSEAEARLRLIRACTHASRQGETVDAGSLSTACHAAIAAALGAADPIADIRFSITCPACAVGWEALFDPAPLLWHALDLSARAQLDDVQLLARTHGWSERDILAMAPSRRRFYLERSGEPAR